MARLGTVVVGLMAGLSAVGAFEADARACGGCFTPPQETPSVVTDHRMVMTISQTESTLYDQIKYSGDPASFAWVLPYSGEITVGLSADVVFSALDSLTQTTILPPPGCGGGGFSSSGSSGTSGNASSSGGASAGDDVTVIKHEVVGPYDTVQLAATNPKALEDWLKQNNYNIPPDVKPVVDGYVNEHFNFLALKLVPNKGVTDMRPVRVTTKGANVALPLRMVAAGTGSKVGISLWVIAGGRYEPQNFDSYVIDDNDLGWDATQQRSNYTDVRDALNAKGKYSIWQIESSIFLNSSQLDNTIRYRYGGGAAEDDYLPVKDGAGNVTKSAEQVRDEDLALLLPADASTRITRMRADLAHAALTRDLVLQAAADQNLLSNTHQLFRCGLPSDPNSTIIRPGQDTTAPVPAAPGTSNAAPSNGGGDGDGTFTCAASNGHDRTFGTIGFSVVGIALARIIRRRRK